MQKLLNLARTITCIPHFPRRYHIADFAAQALKPPDDFVKGSIGPYSLNLDLKDDVQKHIYFGLYDQPETRLIRKILKPGDVFLDVGAYIGYYSLLASICVGEVGKVHAFEPVPKYAKMLTRTIEHNRIDNIIINQMAVGSTDGRLDLFLSSTDSENYGQSSVVKSSDRPVSLEVPVVSLDQYLDSEEIDRVRCVKIDVEGYEMDVFKGMHSLLSRENGPDLLFEVNPKLLKQRGFETRDLTNHIASYGYKLFELNHFGQKAMEPNSTINALSNLYARKLAGS